MRRILFALAFFLSCASPAGAALHFNGTSDCAQSASALTALNGATLGAVQAWVKWTTNANNDKFLMEYSTNTNSNANAFFFDPNESGTGRWQVSVSNNVTSIAQKSFARPTAGSWYHVVVNFDWTNVSNPITTIYVNASSQSLTTDLNWGSGSSFGSYVLYLASRNCASLFGDMDLAHVAAWTGALLTSGEITSLYNSGNGASANSVTTSATLNYFWTLCTTGTATTGGINMTLTGTSAASTNPGTLCGAAAAGNSLLLRGVGP